MSIGGNFPGIVGVRATPGVMPAPNSEPLGARTGAPPRTRLFSMPIIPASAVGVNGRPATEIVPGTAPNRVAILTAPVVGFTIFIGDSGVTPRNGVALPKGQPYSVPLVGLQDLYAVTDAPVWLQLQVAITAVLMAEQQRKTE